MSSIATPTRPRREHPRLRAKIIALGWRPALEEYGSWYGSWDGGTYTSSAGRGFLYRHTRGMAAEFNRMVREGYFGKITIHRTWWVGVLKREERKRRTVQAAADAAAPWLQTAQLLGK